MIDDNWVSPVYLKSKCHPVVRIIIPENEDAGKRHSLCEKNITSNITYAILQGDFRNGATSKGDFKLIK